ncbi:MAG: sigma 54-interacting transcriptional regulator [Pirellulaceae bacterium]|nr:sigma 54-interacting transcriptional regulator [Pirellulaceae bacterium]
MTAYFVVTRGSDLDHRFALDPTVENKLGRGLGCQVLVSDPLSSRVQASIRFQSSQWVLTDTGSRNGTLVNGSKVDEAVLVHGSKVQIGGTELEFFEEPEQTRNDVTIETINLAHSLLSENVPFTRSAFSTLRDRKRLEELLDLYQLASNCLSIVDQNRTIEMTLEVLRLRTKATVAGFLFLDDHGALRPQLILPPDGVGKLQRLSNKLTELVSQQMTAIWAKNEQRRHDHDGSLKHYTDAICVPILQDQKTVGALHLYRDTEQFEAHHFDFTISAAKILSSSLARARTQEALQANHDRLIAKNADFDELLGESEPMKELKERIVRIARASGTVLIRGESGSGKELVARAIHREGQRAGRPMLSVNCAAIPSELMESQLFGHTKGAFTGADKDHSGWFQQANGGTLFLDEVGELTLGGQAKLLRILEGHPFLPVGSSKEIRVDVRVLTATNRDLRDFVREKRFREDLYYRLCTFELNIPPLRQRGSDIGLLLDHFFDHFRLSHGRPNLAMSPQVRERLLKYPWPGNVRQLRNVIDSATVLAVGDEVRPSDLALHETSVELFDTLRIDNWEQRLIRESLKRTNGSIPEAAEMLGVSRATLYRKLESYNIPKDGRET